MTDVIIALIPALLVSGVVFGGNALMLTGFCMISAMALERLCNFLMKKESTIGDLSAAVTGMLLAFNLPVTISYFKAFIGVFAAIVITKQLFGGLGQNFANPAIVGRIVLMVSFPAAMTNWAVPFFDEKLVETGATPLVTGSESYQALFLGNVGGCLGETSAAALLLGALYLIAKKVIDPAAPLAFVGTVLCFSYLTGRDGLYQILSGGLILGAFFAGLVYVVIAIVVKMTGSGWVHKIMPAVVIGPTVAIIGLSLAGNAIGDALHGASLIDGVYEMTLSGWVNLICALVTLLTVIFFSVKGKKMLKLIPFSMPLAASVFSA